VRGNTFFVRNSNSTGVADMTFNYGDAGDIVLAGCFSKNPAVSGPAVCR
jgi:hypothetical protein